MPGPIQLAPVRCQSARLICRQAPVRIHAKSCERIIAAHPGPAIMPDPIIAPPAAAVPQPA